MNNSIAALPKKNYRSMRAATIVKRAVIVAVLIFFAFCQTFPFYLQLVRAFQPFDFIPEYSKIYLWPEAINFGNFTYAFRAGDLGRGFLNTSIVAVTYTFLSAIVVLIVGYVLGKINFRGKNIIFMCLLATMMVPGEVLLVPNYFMMIKLRLVDTLAALFLPGLVNIFGIFLVKQFMTTIPDTVLEAARIDGASEIKTLYKILLPMSLPIISTYCILTFISMWNEYLWPMIVLKTDTNYTLQIKLMYFNPSFATDWDQTLLAAGLMLTLIPVLAFYAVFQRQFIEGISVTGMK